MMTTYDKTLLEQAAKAAEIIPSDFGGQHDLEEWWNPLTDDGDALRLAVKLDLLADTGLTFQFMEASGDIEATRRAIVRAAAEIGKTL